MTRADVFNSVVATAPLLTVTDLTVTLSRNGHANHALDAIGFDVFPGEIVAVVGESGSGKTSLGLALQGLLPHDSAPHVTGSIRLSGMELVGATAGALRSARRHVVRAIPQDPTGALNPTLTIGRQMRESTDRVSILGWLRRTGLDDPERVAGALPHRLSGGQCQRVLIAMAMMAKPRLLIADEPTTALDVTVQAEILDLLRDLACEQRTAILFITHDLGVARTLADRIIVLYAGRIVETGRIEDVFCRPAHPYSAALIATRFDLETDRSRPLPSLPVSHLGSTGSESSCGYAPRCMSAEAACNAIRPMLRAAPTHGGAAACLFAERTALLAKQGGAVEPWPTGTVRTEVALRLSDVGKTFPTGVRTVWGRRSKPVLKSVNLAIRLGECLALVGESGAGKSTVLRIAAGLLSPDSGSVWRIDGALPQVVFQDPVSALTPWLSIGEQVGERLRVLGQGVDERHRAVEEALHLVGLDPTLMRALPSELSFGQCQRALLARAVVVPPKLLLCDEPTSGLDVSLAAATLNLLGDLRRRLGMAMLFVTHDLAAARIIADRIAVLHDGELVEIGEADALTIAPRAAYTRSLAAARPRRHLGRGR